MRSFLIAVLAVKGKPQGRAKLMLSQRRVITWEHEYPSDEITLHTPETFTSEFVITDETVSKWNLFVSHHYPSLNYLTEIPLENLLLLGETDSKGTLRLYPKFDPANFTTKLRKKPPKYIKKYFLRKLFLHFTVEKNWIVSKILGDIFEALLDFFLICDFQQRDLFVINVFKDFKKPGFVEAAILRAKRLSDEPFFVNAFITGLAFGPLLKRGLSLGVLFVQLKLLLEDAGNSAFSGIKKD